MVCISMERMQGMQQCCVCIWTLSAVYGFCWDNSLGEVGCWHAVPYQSGTVCVPASYQHMHCMFPILELVTSEIEEGGGKGVDGGRGGEGEEGGEGGWSRES